MSNRPTVAIIYRAIPQYRRRFYDDLRAKLAAEGVTLKLIYGQPGSADAAKADTVALPWASPIVNRIFRIGRLEIFWQPCLSLLRDVDLVIVEQANKLLLNYILLALRAMGMKRVALWGHGVDFMADHIRLRDRIKRVLSTRVDWWFAYTQNVSRIVESFGFPAERITNTQNAIDTRALVAARQRITGTDVQRVRDELGLKGNNVCLYSGALYREKRIDFLLDAAVKIRSVVPDFELIIIGAGRDADLIRKAQADYPWIHWPGSKFDEAKIPYFAASKLLLMPGAVGLVVLDCFALGVPMVTTAVSTHGPEIEYLERDKNGVIVDDWQNSQAFADAVSALLTNEAARARLVRGCAEASIRYTNEEMVERFAQGILSALSESGIGRSKQRLRHW